MKNFTHHQKSGIGSVDNVISVILSSDEAWLLDHLNEQHPRKKFTKERENERKMPFMDVLFKRFEDRRWTEPCTKSQHTGRYLSFDSHHPIKLCSDEKSKKGEIGHIMGEMQGNGYPKKFIEKAVRDQLKKASVPPQSSEDEETNKEEWQAARIPFIEGVSYEVRRIAWEAGI